MKVCIFTVKYAWMDKQQEFTLAEMCVVLDVSVSGYQLLKPDDLEPKMWINRAARTNPAG